MATPASPADPLSKKRKAEDDLTGDELASDAAAAAATTAASSSTAPNGKRQKETVEQTLETNTSTRVDPQADHPPSNTATPGKRGPGRPRKNPVSPNAGPGAEIQGPKRKRGRPPRVRPSIHPPLGRY